MNRYREEVKLKAISWLSFITNNDKDNCAKQYFIILLALCTFIV